MLKMGCKRLRKCCVMCFACGCCEYATRVALMQPPFLMKILQIILIAVDLAGTEGGLFYLQSVNVSWMKGGFSNFIINRIVLWLSLVTTTTMLVLSVRNWKRRIRDPMKEPTCIRCKGWQALGNRDFVKKPYSRCSMIYGDYLHSLLAATSFLSCAFSTITNIPNDYDHKIEVAIKLYGFIWDLILGLLFTKSCIDSYTAYEGPGICYCDDIIYDRPPTQVGSSAPPDDRNKSSDEEVYETLLPQNKRTSAGYTYTKLSF